MSQGVITLPQDLGDRYVIERELGHGATATVYLARDLKFEGRLVAIKILSADFALAVPAERFLREINTTAKLNHPHIVPLFDAGTTQGSPPRPFYVMRFIDGDVLSDVIGRGPLSIPEALRIAKQAASALGHAHRHGVIHRDIKPGNMILEDGHTWVTDFGIARAIASDDSATVTSTGVTIGTPAYMSPEQAMGRADLDGRTDIYSLGCVLYEMLAGKMPFDGPDIQAVMNKHLVEPMPSIREFRPDVPERVEQLLDIALAKNREDRFPTAAEFAEALSLEGAGALTPTHTQPVPGPHAKRRKMIQWKPRWAAAAGVTLVVGVIVVAAMLRRPELKADHYLVTSDWQYGQGVNASMDAGRLLQDQLNQWKGITVMGPSNANDASRPGASARHAGAAWYVRGGVSRVGDSLRVRAQLYGTRGDVLVRERSVNVSRTLERIDSAFARLADQLVFDDTVWAANGGQAGTRSVAARRAFGQGLDAVQAWDLNAADSSFRRATEGDPSYGQAHLWLAQVRYWQTRPPATWTSSAERAATGAIGFSARDRTLSRALLLLGRGALPEACAEWDDLTHRDASDFVGWYGLATCLKGDKAVMRDPHQPSGWRFRSSYHHALKAYQRAFQLLPATLQSFRADGYENLRLLLMLSSSLLRLGRALPPDTTSFLAQGMWQNDSLAMIPYRMVDWPHRVRPSREQNEAGLQYRRQMFREIATAWVTASPRSSGAFEALAISLEMLGDRTSVDTFRKARVLETNGDDRARLAEMEVWLRVKFSIPTDVRGVQLARALADSILANREPRSAAESGRLATLAALTGKGYRAASLSRGAATDLGAGAMLANTAPALLAFAGLGGPRDSLQILEHDVETAINTLLPSHERQTARMRWLARCATLAFPVFHFRSLPDLVSQGNPVVDAEASYLRGDTAAVRHVFVELQRVRQAYSSADITFDALYPETFLLAALGDTAEAIRWLDPTLNALAGTPPQVFNDPARSAALVQAMALRAELASHAGDSTTAARWARIVRILWSDADSFLVPTVQRMRTLESLDQHVTSSLSASDGSDAIHTRPFTLAFSRLAPKRRMPI